MTDESHSPFILPDSVLQRRRGLLEGAMPEPPPHQWAEHLELLTADGKLTSVGDMLELMHSELGRLKDQIDASEEPDRHSEAALAASTASFLDEKATPEQRGVRRELYFAILLGYLYGRLTKPGEKSEKEATITFESLWLAREGNAKGGRNHRKMNLAEFKEAWFEWVEAECPGTKSEFDTDIAERFGVTEKNVQRERLKLQREYKIVEKKLQQEYLTSTSSGDGAIDSY